MGQRRKRLFNHDLVIRLHFLLLLHLATVAIYVYTICVDNRITFYTHLQHNEKYNFQHVWAAACKCHVNMVYCIDMTFQMDSTLNHLDLFWSPKILDTFAFGSILCSQAISHYFFFFGECRDHTTSNYVESWNLSDSFSIVIVWHWVQPVASTFLTDYSWARD